MVKWIFFPKDFAESDDIKILTLDMAKFLAYILAMKTANIGDLKDNLSKFINLVEQGQVIEICKRNIPVALLVPHGIKKTQTAHNLDAAWEPFR